ncbi:MAG: MarR family transcriptional regulator [Ruminococcaceae bacterium]|nr:MarR family transcriptional regulator [Oscillospiraceae bacterium]
MEIENRDRFEDFSTLIGSAMKSLQKIKNHGMEPYGLGSTHTLCLKRLNASPEGLTRKELAIECEIDKAQISRLIGELSEKGYVRDKTETAGYRNKIVLTESGKKVADEVEQKVRKVLEYVSGDIPPEQITVLYKTLETICENLKRAEDMPLGNTNISN